VLQVLEAVGLLSGKVRYGSAYSGIDTFAVAMEVELGIGGVCVCE